MNSRFSHCNCIHNNAHGISKTFHTMVTMDVARCLDLVGAHVLTWKTVDCFSQTASPDIAHKWKVYDLYAVRTYNKRQKRRAVCLCLLTGLLRCRGSIVTVLLPISLRHNKTQTWMFILSSFRDNVVGGNMITKHHPAACSLSFSGTLCMWGESRIAACLIESATRGRSKTSWICENDFGMAENFGKLSKCVSCVFTMSCQSKSIRKKQKCFPVPQIWLNSCMKIPQPTRNPISKRLQHFCDLHPLYDPVPYPPVQGLLLFLVHCSSQQHQGLHCSSQISGGIEEPVPRMYTSNRKTCVLRACSIINIFDNDWWI